MTIDAEAVKAEATRIGFIAAGIAPLAPSIRGDALDRWLAAGYAGTMRYLHRQARRRKEPALATPGAIMAVVVLDNYAAPTDEQPTAGDAFKIAAYARGMDYHVVTHGRLHQLAEWMKAHGAGLAHTWVDDGPIPERELAERAGLGWIGRNTMLIHPRHGSYTFIGTVFTDLALEVDTPRATDLCGTCTRCIDACPTGAIIDDRVVDATRCLSYQTIENRSEPPAELAPQWDGWAFGCDVCNDVCPWNVKFATPTTVPEFSRRADPDRRNPDVFEQMDEAAFTRRFADTPLARPGLARMRRNVRLATASRRDPDSR
ncbi:MAG: tRNA epoxyqueuosine(34) reductase QueG [Gemmatimonadales bacterium]|nr:tRNA epoxyqueuosine(34) reductase QueG [Gemmatimonadales bacterium]